MSAMTAIRIRPAVGWHAGARAAASGRPRRVVPSQAPLRLTARGRLVLIALVALLVLGGSLLLGARGAQADGPVPAREVQRHVVATGETLWAIASSIATPDEDVRDVVNQLVRLNGLPSSALTAGQTIVVPVSG